MFNFLRRILAPTSIFRKIFWNLKSFVAAILFRFPARDLKIIGVTGTDGKTTTAEMIFQILQNCGKKVAKISTAEFSIGDKTWENETKRTSVSPFLMQKFLRKCVLAKVDAVILETSSHALFQNRFFGVKFAVGVLTNISNEHLDFHKTIENLRAAKKLLFSKFLQKGGTAILPADAEFTENWADEISRAGKIAKTFSLQNPAADFFGKNFTDQKNGIEFEITETKFTAPVFGDFNAENLLAAVGAISIFNFTPAKVAAAAAKFKSVAGRCESIDCGQDFEIFVDFALTPQAFEKVLSALKKRTAGNLIVVFGAAGDHDATKRPILGKIAREICDSIILTDDETYGESAEKIRTEIKSGIFENEIDAREVSLDDKSFFEIPERKVAIQTALQNAHSGDAVAILGMGNFNSRNLNGREVAWNDREVVLEIFSAGDEKARLKNLQSSVGKS